MTPIAIGIAQCQRNQGGAGIDGRLEQRGMKAPDGQAVAGGALGIDANDGTGLQRRHDGGIHMPRGAAPAAFDEQRSDASAQPAHQRPLANLRLGDKNGRMAGQHDEDVQPGNVIGDQHAHRRQRIGMVGGVHANGQDGQQLARPAPHFAALSRR